MGEKNQTQWLGTFCLWPRSEFGAWPEGLSGVPTLVPQADERVMAIIMWLDPC